MNASFNLKSFIQERIKDLEKYAQRPDAKDVYLAKQNEQIRQLTAIYNSIPNSDSYGIGVLIEKEFELMQQLDPNFSGLITAIRVKPNGALCYLPLNLYQHGI